jgi:RND family efflux transporter MFP subunit
MNRNSGSTLALLLLVLMGSTMSCSSIEAGPTGAPARVAMVRTATVVRRDLSNDLPMTAEFEPYQEVDVMAKIAGYIRTISVDVGDWVRAGQVLATLDVPELQDELAKAAAEVERADAELAAATGEVKRAEATHEIARLSHQRLQRVSDVEPGLVPRQEVDEVRARDLAAEAQSASAQSKLSAATHQTRVARAEHARLETLHRYTSVMAPFEGVVTKRYANVGAMIQAGTSSQATPVVRVADQKRLRLILPVPEAAVPSVRLSPAVGVRVPTLDRTFEGRVARFTARIQQTSRTMDTQVDVSNPDLVLVPGMYAEVTLRVQESKGAKVVPVDAVDRSQASPRAFTVLPSGVVHIVPLTLGIETPTHIEVASGLSDGDRVIVGRRSELREGDKVESQPIEAAAPQVK